MRYDTTQWREIAQHGAELGIMVGITPKEMVQLLNVIDEQAARIDAYASGTAADCARAAIKAANQMIQQRDKLLAILKRAEDFIAGFEGDEAQEGIDELLAEMRAAMVI